MSGITDDPIERAINLLKQSRYAVAFTGAGISTPSGIPDFRSPNSGIWEKHDPMRVATIYAFKKNPQDFFEWMHPLAKLILAAEPNPAHLALADLENYGPVKAIITQNIDMLHHRAGSKNIFEVHGHLRQATCIECGREEESGQLLIDFVASTTIPYCQACGGVLKPNVTLFGEMPPLEALISAEHETMACDLMLVAGSSLEVLPVGELPRVSKQNGAKLIIVDYVRTHLDYMADVVIRGDVAEVFPLLAAPFIPN